MASVNPGYLVSKCLPSIHLIYSESYSAVRLISSVYRAFGLSNSAHVYEQWQYTRVSLYFYRRLEMTSKAIMPNPPTKSTDPLTTYSLIHHLQTLSCQPYHMQKNPRCRDALIFQHPTPRILRKMLLILSANYRILIADLGNNITERVDFPHRHMRRE